MPIPVFFIKIIGTFMALRSCNKFCNNKFYNIYDHSASAHSLHNHILHNTLNNDTIPHINAFHCVCSL
jgi:hypothetical protein